MRLPAERLSLMRQRQRANGEQPKRLPGWLRAPLPSGERYKKIRSTLRDRSLHTVCEEAQCPNIGECWNEGTATMMLMGDTCTRTCKFCAVRFDRAPDPLDPQEPQKAAEQVALMGLDYIVMTSVNRDDLPDGGAGHFAATISAIRARNPDTLVEVLVPDFQGLHADVDTVLAAGPHVFAHNVETVAAWQDRIRDRRASWAQSLDVLAHAANHAGDAVVKTSIMLGLGEDDEQVDEALVALREAGVEAITLGQYLRPSPWHAEVQRFVTPEAFEGWQARCIDLGYRYAACGPLVRSSYRAGEFYLRAMVDPRVAGGHSD